MPPRVSVVMTVRNAIRTLGGTLEDLSRLSWPHDRLQVVIVDAHSEDGTWDLLCAWRGSVDFEVVLHQRAGGISVGRNRAFELADGGLVAVTDADMRVPPDWIRQLLAGMEEGVGVVGGPNEGVGATYLARCTDIIPIHGPSRGAVPAIDANRFHEAFTTDSDPIAAVTRNCLFRKEAFVAAGGFDATLVTGEDIELNRRILDAGYQIRYLPSAGVTHSHRQSLRGFVRQVRNYGRGQALVNRKDPRMRRVLHLVPGAVGAAWLAAAAFTLIAWWPVAALTGLGAAAGVAYGLKAAWVRRRPSLLVGASLLFVVWQAAWAVGYLEGWLGRGRGGSHAGA